MAFKIPKPRIARPRLETFDRGHAQSSVYRMLPSPMTALYGAVVAGSITGVVWLAGDLSGHNGFQWSMIAMGVMTVIAFAGQGWSFLRGKRAQKSQQEFGEAVTESAGGAVEDVSDPAEVARVDDLRKKFQDGVKVFHEYGKDIYALPWYVIVGEPGSGKSEAIRNSQLRFPEMLTDRLQGTGGTYSMHWWFTNNAVLLDTAGAMLMQPEATERFEEFLRLLRSHRPDCPINGLLLAIPVDSLFIDDPVRTEEKARTIATQLEVIQEALDIRFPIYLLITKGDRLPGFREFFDAPGQQTFEPEMVGWSNPYGLDQPFRPEQVYEALEEIASRLRARRLALLSDPIPRQAGARRIDEVDALYAYPEVVVSLGERLERYLRVIFQTGAWETRPPFFRGLYFTSALREGSALDSELASALGVPVESLPVGGIWDRQKSVHLRDVFLEKIFREQGLVTRLLDIAAAFRRRLVWLLATTAALVLGLLLFFFLTYSSITTDLAKEESFWKAGNATWDNGRFLSIIDQIGGQQAPPLGFAYRGDIPAGKDIDGNEQSRLGFIESAHKETSKHIAGGWVFRPLERFRRFEDNRLAAGRTLFEGGVMKPLVDAAREKLWWDANLGFGWWPSLSGAPPNDTDLQNRAREFAEAFKALVWLEGQVQEPDPSIENKGNQVLKMEDYQKHLFTPLLGYVLSSETGTGRASDRAISTCAKLAVDVYDDRFPLPSRRWLADGGSDLGIKTISALNGFATETGDAQRRMKEVEIKVKAKVKEFENEEDILASTAFQEEATARSFTSLKDKLDKLGALNAEMKTLLGENPIGGGGQMHITTELLADIAKHINTHAPQVRWLEGFVKTSTGSTAPDFKPAQDCDVRLTMYEKNLSRTDSRVASSSVPDVEALLKDAGASASAPPKPTPEVDDKLLRKEVAQKILTFLLSGGAEARDKAHILSGYAAVLYDDLGKLTVFPFVKNGIKGTDVDDLRREARRWHDHRKNLEFLAIVPQVVNDVHEALNDAHQQLLPLHEVIAALTSYEKGVVTWRKMNVTLTENPSTLFRRGEPVDEDPGAFRRPGQPALEPRPRENQQNGMVPNSAMLTDEAGKPISPGPYEVYHGFGLICSIRALGQPERKISLLAAEMSKPWALVERLARGSGNSISSMGGEVTLMFSIDPAPPKRWPDKTLLQKAMRVIEPHLPGRRPANSPKPVISK